MQWRGCGFLYAVPVHLVSWFEFNAEPGLVESPACKRAGVPEGTASWSSRGRWEGVEMPEDSCRKTILLPYCLIYFGAFKNMSQSSSAGCLSIQLRVWEHFYVSVKGRDSGRQRGCCPLDPHLCFPDYLLTFLSEHCLIATLLSAFLTSIKVWVSCARWGIQNILSVNDNVSHSVHPAQFSFEA